MQNTVSAVAQSNLAFFALATQNASSSFVIFEKMTRTVRNHYPVRYRIAY